MVGGSKSKLASWSDMLKKVTDWLSRWKIKTLSIGDRLTLLKSVLGSIPTYYMEIYGVHDGNLAKLEALRRKFFNGVNKDERNMSMVSCEKVLAAKDKGGLGVGSYFALNRVLLFK